MMPEDDRRLIQAALEGSLSVDDVADVILMVLRAYSRVDADRIIESIISQYGGTTPERRRKRVEPFGLYAPDRALQRAQAALLQEAYDHLGRDWLLDWSDAVERFAAAYGQQVAESRLESHRRAGFVVAILLDSDYRIPRFQFTETGEVFSAAANANRTLLAGMRPWAALSWWVYPDGRLLDRRPFELLHDPEQGPTLAQLARASVGPAE
jgi:hypothetical protein